MLFCPPLPPLRLTIDEAVAIGRHSSCQLAIRREDISRRHAEVRYEEERFVIRDFGSTNGTYVNGSRLQGVHTLSPGDRIEVVVEQASARRNVLRLSRPQVGVAAG